MQCSDKYIKRCPWPGNDPLYIQYHDHEWGVPVYNDEKLFEFLILETFQAGLSWITILRKRENFRTAFDHFDYSKIAVYNKDKINELLKNPGIVRNRLKIQSAVSNAQAFIRVQTEYGSFSKYIWGFVNHQTMINRHQTMKEVPAKTGLSDQISKDMKKRGFKFVGSTVIYAYMQAVGMVNDHLMECYRQRELS